MIAVLSDDSRIDVISLESYEPISRIEHPGHGVFCSLYFSPDDSLIYADDEEKTFFVWRTRDGRLMSKFRMCVDLSMDPHSPNVAVLTIPPNETSARFLSVISLMTGEIVNEVQAPDDRIFSSLHYSPDGRSILVQSDNELTIYGATNLAILGSTSVYMDIVDFNYTADGDYVIVNVFVGDGKWITQVMRSSNLTTAFIIDDGSVLVSVLQAGNAFVTQSGSSFGVHDADHGTVTVYDVPVGFILMAVSPDSAYAIGFQDDELIEYNLDDGLGVFIHTGGYSVILSHNSIV
jgi:WD40 repeat protein